MTKAEIVKLGTNLGLLFNENDNFKDQLERNIVVFNGCNGQRFLIDGSWNDSLIIKELGIALIKYGMRLKAMDLNSVMSIMSDTTSIPLHLSEE